MTTFYAKSTGGFYHSDVHGGSVPSDAVAITAEQHAALMQAQSQGKAIQANEEGQPVAVDRPAYVPTVKDQIVNLEAEITPRRLREAVLGTDGGWLKAQNDQIAGLRAKLAASTAH